MKQVQTQATADATSPLQGRALEMPSSYRHFVEATSGVGWSLPGNRSREATARIELHPVAKIGEMKSLNAVTWKSWNDNKLGRPIADEIYYNYSKTQEEGLFRDEYLDALVQVADLGDGIVLVLNPMEKSADGEWEAWFLSTRLAGAWRFRSFAELMQLVYAMDVDPQRDISALSAKDFKGTCAERIYLSYRQP
jgi:hypothetical protein